MPSRLRPDTNTIEQRPHGCQHKAGTTSTSVVHRASGLVVCPLLSSAGRIVLRIRRRSKSLDMRRLQSVHLSSTFKLSCRPPRGFAFEAADFNLHDHQVGCVLFERPARLGTMSEAETRVARDACNGAST